MPRLIKLSFNNRRAYQYRTPSITQPIQIPVFVSLLFPVPSIKQVRHATSLKLKLETHPVFHHSCSVPFRVFPFSQISNTLPFSFLQTDKPHYIICTSHPFWHALHYSIPYATQKVSEGLHHQTDCHHWCIPNTNTNTTTWPCVTKREYSKRGDILHKTRESQRALWKLQIHCRIVQRQT